MTMIVFEPFVVSTPFSPSEMVIVMVSAAAARVHGGTGQDECSDGEGGRKRCRVC